MICRDRPRLTEQCLRTLYANTDFNSFNLVIVDDGSRYETREILMRYAIRKNCEVVTFLKSVGIVGFLRNVGAWASERFFGRGDYVCFLDNDVALLVNWLERMTMVLDHDEPAVLGGCRHPFHGVTLEVNARRFGWQRTDAVAGYSMMMRWGTWDLYGPFDQHAKGTGQSEDYAFCQRARNGGKGRIGGPYQWVDGEPTELPVNFVGYIHPPVLAHCGLVNSDGQPATGHESIARIPGLLYE